MSLKKLKKKVFRPHISKVIHEECQALNNKWVDRKRIIERLLDDPIAGEMLENDYTIKVTQDGKSYKSHSDTIERWTGSIVDFFSQAHTECELKIRNEDDQFWPYYKDLEKTPNPDTKNAAYRLRKLESRSSISIPSDKKEVIDSLTRKSFRDMKDLSNIFLEVGRLGEEMIRAFLEEKKQEGVIEGFKWISDKYATAPYDFEIKTNGITRKIDVKSTTASFLTPFYLSNAEVMTLLDDGHPYDIYRVYNLDIKEKTASLMVIRDMGSYSHHFSFLARSPQGIQIDSIKVSPIILNFDADIFELSLNSFE